MEINLYATEALGEQSVVRISEAVFAKKFNEPLIHQVVNAYLTQGRAGTRAQKNRARVSGGGAKPWRQKGTGRARAGTIRSPLWRGGGVTFAASPNDYAQKVNKKMYRSAVCSILSELLRQARLKVVHQFAVTSHKTQDLVAQLKALAIIPSAQTTLLIILEKEDTQLALAARNLPHVAICTATNVDPVSLIKSAQILTTVAAMGLLEDRFERKLS